LWGYLKIIVYMSKPKTITELKESIRSEMANISADMLEIVIKNARKMTLALRTHSNEL